MAFANNKALSTKPTIAQIGISCSKGTIFYATEICATHGQRCLLWRIMCQKSYETGSQLFDLTF